MYDVDSYIYMLLLRKAVYILRRKKSLDKEPREYAEHPS